MNTVTLIYQYVLFFLPAGIANLSPVLANKIPLLNRWRTPLDFGLRFRGKRILGDHKTWRGLVFGTLLAGSTGLIIYPFIHVTNYDGAQYAFLLGSLLGLGALLGDAIESFIKRRLNVPPGKSWFPYDQIDYIIGGLLIVMPFVQLTFGSIVTIFVAYFGLHLLFAYIGFQLGLKDKPM